MNYNRNYSMDSEDGVCGEEVAPDYAAINRAVTLAMSDEFGGNDYIDGDDTDDDDEEVDEEMDDDSNAPCDTYGPAACTSACKYYFTKCGK